MTDADSVTDKVGGLDDVEDRSRCGITDWVATEGVAVANLSAERSLRVECADDC